MPELSDKDAIMMMLEYFAERYSAAAALHLANTLLKIDMVGLVRFVFKKGVEYGNLPH